nr:wsv448 [Shrimp white spot syndrome virus]
MLFLISNVEYLANSCPCISVMAMIIAPYILHFLNRGYVAKLGENIFVGRPSSSSKVLFSAPPVLFTCKENCTLFIG